MSVFDIASLMIGAVAVFASGWFIWATSSDDRTATAIDQIIWIKSKLGRRLR